MSYINIYIYIYVYMLNSPNMMLKLKNFVLQAKTIQDVCSVLPYTIFSFHQRPLAKILSSCFGYKCQVGRIFISPFSQFNTCDIYHGGQKTHTHTHTNTLVFCKSEIGKYMQMYIPQLI